MIIAVMLPSLTKIGILIDFKINQDFIEDVLCINKDTPIKMCKGKCYLSNQLKKVENQEEKQAPSSKKERIDVVYYHCKQTLDFQNLADRYLSSMSPGANDELHTSSFISAIFRPPKGHLI